MMMWYSHAQRVEYDRRLHTNMHTWPEEATPQFATGFPYIFVWGTGDRPLGFIHALTAELVGGTRTYTYELAYCDAGLIRYTRAGVLVGLTPDQAMRVFRQACENVQRHLAERGLDQCKRGAR